MKKKKERSLEPSLQSDTQKASKKSKASVVLSGNPAEGSPRKIELFIESAIVDANKKILHKLAMCNSLIGEELSWSQAGYEKENFYGERFVKIVKKENDFFSIKHVDKIGLPYDILIFLGKKNIGKSCEMYRLIDETLKRGKKFIFIRYSKSELEKSVEGFNSDSLSPVYMIKDKFVGKFYNRQSIKNALAEEGDDIHRLVNQQWLKAHSIPLSGYAYEFCYCQSYTGAQYEDFDLILYDECLTYDPRNSLNEKHLNNGAAFLSSIARNKPNLKVFLFGNLQATNNQILDFYGVGRDDKLRYIARGGLEGCRILFINGGDLYKGYESQTRTARHAGGHYALKLEGNEYLIKSDKLIPPRAFNLFNHFVFFFGCENLVALKGFTFTGSVKKIGAVSFTPFQGYEDFGKHKIYTDNKTIMLKYSNLTYIPTLFPYIARLMHAIFTNNIKFANEESIEHASLLFLEDPYSTGLVPSGQKLR